MRVVQHMLTSWLGTMSAVLEFASIHLVAVNTYGGPPWVVDETLDAWQRATLPTLCMPCTFSSTLGTMQLCSTN